VNERPTTTHHRDTENTEVAQRNPIKDTTVTTDLLDTPKRRLLHYAVFFHFSILASVYYKEFA
jgi:hypothetical protein